MDRMEQQIAALTSLMTSQMMGQAASSVTSSPASLSSPPAEKRKRRDKAFPPPPTAMADEPSYQDQLAEAMKALDPSFKQTGGKKQPAIRPHLFIPRRHRPSKTSDQENTPFPHFVTGMAGMVLSMLEDQSSPAAAACRHLREGAKDTNNHPWSTVREWSKSTFDRLALGEIRWDDYEEMQRERLMICFSAPAITPTIVPCPYFSAGNCQHILLPAIAGREFCPLAALDAMLAGAPRASPHAPLFITRAGHILPLGFLKRAWQRAVKAVGLPQERLSLHSLRSGGATAAWGSGAVSELDLMRHGTWTSSAWKGYIRPAQSASMVHKAFRGLKK